MQMRKRPVRLEVPGPLDGRSVPDEVLYDAHLRFQHDAGAQATTALREALLRFGTPRIRRLPFVGTRIHLEGGRYPLVAKTQDEAILITLRQRLKGKALARFVDALATVPGARDLEIAGTTPEFDAPYADIGPCSPCAASRYPTQR